MSGKLWIPTLKTDLGRKCNLKPNAGIDEYRIQYTEHITLTISVPNTE